MPSQTNDVSPHVKAIGFFAMAHSMVLAAVAEAAVASVASDQTRSAARVTVLAGGSAYGLGTANGVMSYLEERGVGYDTGYALVPLVAQADIYDLSVGDAAVRPDAAMGYEAARLAFESPIYRDGNYGVGCGASVGKIAWIPR